jgi:hypothetical protein
MRGRRARGRPARPSRNAQAATPDRQLSLASIARQKSTYGEPALPPEAGTQLMQHKMVFVGDSPAAQTCVLGQANVETPAQPAPPALPPILLAPASALPPLPPPELFPLEPPAVAPATLLAPPGFAPPGFAPPEFAPAEFAPPGLAPPVLLPLAPLLIPAAPAFGVSPTEPSEELQPATYSRPANDGIKIFRIDT